MPYERIRDVSDDRMGTTSIQDLRSRKFWVALLAELLGTALLVVFTCGSCIMPDADAPDPNSKVIRISLTFGFTVATLVWAICNVSGGHINPAVTIGFFVTRRISIVRFIFYLVVQCGGAICGALILKFITPVAYRGTLCTSDTSTGAEPVQVFGIELIITFTFVLTVMASCDGHRTDIKGSAPLAIGLGLCIGHLWAVPHTGAGMNPARVLGPAVVSGHWNNHWAYWIGPMLGGVVAGLLYEFVLADNATPIKVRACCSSRHYDDDHYDKYGEAPDGNDRHAAMDMKDL